MKNKIILLPAVLTVILSENSFGAFTGRKAATRPNISWSKPDTRISLADKYNTEKETSQPQVFTNAEFRNIPVSNPRGYSRGGGWCVAHKAGLISVCGGAALLLLGYALLTTVTSNTSQSKADFPAGMVLVGSIFFLIGIPVLIGGSIYDHLNR